MREPITITLGGRTFTVRPLTLRQVESIEAALGSKNGSIRGAVDVVAAGLARDHADMTADALYEAEITPEDISTAMASMLRHGGFLPAGEAKAAPETASTGEPSAAA